MKWRHVKGARMVSHHKMLKDMRLPASGLADVDSAKTSIQ